MKLAGGVLAAVLISGVWVLAASGAQRVPPHEEAKEKERVTSDGRLRPGHLETFRATGFPGKGILEVSFFPTAICEDECGARSFRGARTNAQGRASFRVRVPGTFFDHRNRPVFFRDGERINVDVTWEGPNDSFAVASVQPEQILVRTHGAPRG